GSKSDVLPKPNARRRCTPAPSMVGLALTTRFTGRRDMWASSTDSMYAPASFAEPRDRLAIITTLRHAHGLRYPAKGFGWFQVAAILMLCIAPPSAFLVCLVPTSTLAIALLLLVGK